MTILNASTFEATSTDSTREIGTVEATLGRETKRVNAERWDDGRIVSWDFTGRYRTSTKQWPATVMLRNDGSVSVLFGKDHHSRHCQKTGLSFK
jgi:hypothetical protein